MTYHERAGARLSEWDTKTRTWYWTERTWRHGLGNNLISQSAYPFYLAAVSLLRSSEPTSSSLMQKQYIGGPPYPRFAAAPPSPQKRLEN
jgi:hypothetical protein